MSVSSAIVVATAKRALTRAFTGSDIGFHLLSEAELQTSKAKPAPQMIIPDFEEKLVGGVVRDGYGAKFDTPALRYSVLFPC